VHSIAVYMVALLPLLLTVKLASLNVGGTFAILLWRIMLKMA